MLIEKPFSKSYILHYFIYRTFSNDKSTGMENRLVDKKDVGRRKLVMAIKGQPKGFYNDGNASYLAYVNLNIPFVTLYSSFPRCF